MANRFESPTTQDYVADSREPLNPVAGGCCGKTTHAVKALHAGKGSPSIYWGRILRLFNPYARIPYPYAAGKRNMR